MPSRWPTSSGGGGFLTLLMVLALASGAACRRSDRTAAPDVRASDARLPLDASAVVADSRLSVADAGRWSQRPGAIRERVLGGRVVDGQGQPVSGAQVRAVSADGAFWLGGGELGVVPGPVPPIPGADDAQSKGRAHGVGWSRSTDANGRFVLFGLPAADVRLVIDHPQLRPAQSGLIGLAQAKAGREHPVGLNGPWLAVCPTLSAGDRQGKRAARRVKTARCAAHAVAPGAVIVGDMRLKRGGVVRGQVVDEHGKALANALITARDAGLTRLAYSDAQGSFAVAGLLARTEVVADLDGHAPASASVQAAQDETATIALALRPLPAETDGPAAPAVTLAGHVQEWRTGAPVQRFSIGVGPAKRIKVTDLQGHFSIEVPRGCRSLSFSAPGFAPQRVAVDMPESVGEATDARSLRIELRRAGIVHGVALDVSGQPIAGARVSCSGLTVNTDAQGRFEVRGVPVGVHEVQLRGDDGQLVGSDMVSVHADGRPSTVRFDVNR